MSEYDRRLNDFFWRMSKSSRRKFRRIPMETVVAIDTTRALAAGIDVSAGGICFSCVGLNIEVGDTLRVDLTLEDQNFSVDGTAVRVSEPEGLVQEVALAFSDIDPDIRRLIELLETPDES